MNDAVDHPSHYTAHGIECIVIAEHMGFCLGNALKYIWRAGIKTDCPIQDLEKARWYIDRELARLRAVALDTPAGSCSPPSASTPPAGPAASPS